jgi:hypothetical protein
MIYDRRITITIIWARFKMEMNIGSCTVLPTKDLVTDTHAMDGESLARERSDLWTR